MKKTMSYILGILAVTGIAMAAGYADTMAANVSAIYYDINNYNAQTAQSSSSHISLDEAKVIALNRTGLTAGQVTYTGTSFEYDAGIAVYQIEFVSGSMEYELEINAVTGAVMEYDAESIYD